MTFTTYANSNSKAIQAATDVCFWFSLCDREKTMKPGARKTECANAAIEKAVAGRAAYKELWDDLALKLQEAYPDHDFSTGYAAQCVWLASA